MNLKFLDSKDSWIPQKLSPLCNCSKSIFQYTTLISNKEDGILKPILGFGPIDPCVAELGDHHDEIQAEISKHGNMSMDHVCPFEEVITP